MSDHLQLVADFHLAFGFPVRSGAPSIQDADLRARLILEEALECAAGLVGGQQAMSIAVSMAQRVLHRRPSLVDYFDGRLDLEVVMHGTDLTCGTWLAVPEGFAEVMRTNMAKVGGPKDPVTGKQLKPAGWQPPDLASILVKHGWQP